MRCKSSFSKISFKSILVIGMSDSSGTTDSSGTPPATGFMASITSTINSGIDKAKSMMGNKPADTTPTPGGTPAGTLGAPPPPPPPPTDPTFRDKYLTFIPVEVWNYISTAITVLIPFLFAMIVANEMIIYKPTVRAFYFVVTWALCLAFTSFRGIIVMYYVLRWIFNKYKKNEGAGGGFFPTIYSFIPWSTEYDEFGLLRYLTIDIGDQTMEDAMKAESFQKKLKGAYYLGEKMVAYFKVLESANPFRGYPEYEKNFANVKKSLFEMHMPALEIDHEKKEYIVRLHRDGKNKDEFIEITEGSITPDKNEPSKPTKETLHKVSYNKANNTFTLVKNATVVEDFAKQASAQTGKQITPQIEQAQAAAAVSAFNLI
jgi:hypothetical protein